jgi:hypothetical protein
LVDHLALPKELRHRVEDAVAGVRVIAKKYCGNRLSKAV